MNSLTTRTEHDFLGEMELDKAAYYGIQTLRGVRMSRATGHSIGEEQPLLIKHLALLKKAAAAANMEIGALAEGIGRAVMQAANEVMAGRFNGEFPVDVLTGGGGVSIHMNTNEVIAHRAAEILCGDRGSGLVHPNTHVNMGQSTNDVLPAAMHLSLHILLNETVAALGELRTITEKKGEEFADVVKIGRTCLQDALPLTLGQEFSGYAEQMRRSERKLASLAEECLTLPLGGTAVGTGSGTLPGYLDALYRHLGVFFGKTVRPAADFFDAFQSGDLYVRISAELKILAVGLARMAKDLRLFASGPRAGFREIVLPAVLPGSSIMPGKINPVLPELMMQTAFLVSGNDLAVSLAAGEGEADLNVWEAVFAKALFESCTLLIRTMPLFATDCVAGIQANRERCRKYAEDSTALAAIVAAVFGYETGSAIARAAIDRDQSICQTVIAHGLMTPEDAETLLRPETMIQPEHMSELIESMRQKYQKPD